VISEDGLLLSSLKGEFKPPVPACNWKVLNFAAEIKTKDSVEPSENIEGLCPPLSGVKTKKLEIS
jgi:hypothetical protein